MITMQTSDAELLRVHTASYQGLRARMCLAINPGTLTSASTTAQWDAAEITSQAADGYARFEWTIAAAAMAPAIGMAKTPAQVVQFQADSAGLGLEWDSAYLVLGTISGGTTTWFTHVTQVYAFSPTKALTAGEPYAMEHSFFLDDLTVVPAS